MKIYNILFDLFSRIDSKESREFERYLIYKNRKKLLELYGCFQNNKDEDAVRYTIKRKKLDRNLRHNLNELFEMLKRFWLDQDHDKIQETEVINNIHFANILYNKGAIELAIEEIQQAEKQADDKRIYPFLFYASNKLAMWSAHQHSKDAYNIYQKVSIKHDEQLRLLSIQKKLFCLGDPVMYLIAGGIWNLNKEELAFLNMAEKELTTLLNEESLPRDLRLGLVQKLAYLSFYVKMDAETTVLYAKEIVLTLEASKKSDAKLVFNKIVAYKLLLFILSVRDKMNEFDLHFQNLNKLVDNQKSLVPVSVCLYLEAVIFHLHYNIIDNSTHQHYLNIVHEDLVKFGDKIPEKLIVNIYYWLAEYHLYHGEIKQAFSYLEKLKLISSRNDVVLKYKEFILEMFIAFEQGEEEFIVNRCNSFRRIATKYLQYNKIGTVFISCMLKLFKQQDKQLRKEILTTHHQKMILLSEKIKYRMPVLFFYLPEWIESKIHGNMTVVELLKAKKKRINTKTVKQIK